MDYTIPGMKTKGINLAINVIAILLIISIIVFIGVGMKCWGCLWYRPTLVENENNNNSENNSENNNNNPIMLAQHKNSKKHKKNRNKLI